MIDSPSPYLPVEQPPVLPPMIRHRLERCLRRHLGDRDLRPVCDQLQRGRIIHDREAAVVAYRNGILFVAGREYVIVDE